MNPPPLGECVVNETITLRIPAYAYHEPILEESVTDQIGIEFKDISNTQMGLSNWFTLFS